MAEDRKEETTEKGLELRFEILIGKFVVNEIVRGKKRE
jgi:hypothetical protein